MTKFGKLVFTIILVAILSIIIFFLQKKPSSEVVYTPPADVVIAENEIIGNKDDLVSFSILPGSKVQGVVFYEGAVKGGYFFEGNILVNILDTNKNLLKAGNTMATTEWMTAEPVGFGGSIDFTLLPKGPAYVEIHNDNASGLPENDKSILIPIVVE